MGKTDHLTSDQRCAVCGEPWNLGHRCKPSPLPSKPITNAEIIEWVQGLISTADMFSRRAEGDEWVEPSYFAALKERLPDETSGDMFSRFPVGTIFQKHANGNIAVLTPDCGNTVVPVETKANLPIRFYVQIESWGTRIFDTADEALRFARKSVYLEPERVPDAEQILAAGKIFEYSYGFTGVMIIPKSPEETKSRLSADCEPDCDCDLCHRPVVKASACTCRCHRSAGTDNGPCIYCGHLPVNGGSSRG